MIQIMACVRDLFDPLDLDERVRSGIFSVLRSPVDGVVFDDWG